MLIKNLVKVRPPTCLLGMSFRNKNCISVSSFSLKYWTDSVENDRYRLDSALGSTMTGHVTEIGGDESSYIKRGLN